MRKLQYISHLLTVTDHANFPSHAWAVSNVRARHLEGIVRLWRLLGVPPPEQLWEGLTAAKEGGGAAVHRTLAAGKACREMHQTFEGTAV